MPEENQARRARILDTAAALFTRYGYDKTTIDDIARDTGISKGAVYLHFKSKVEIFEKLMEREAETLSRELFARLDADPAPLTVFNLYRHSMEGMLASPLMRAVLAQDRAVLGDYVRHLKTTALYQKGMGLGADFVRGFQAAGLIRNDIPPETITYLLMTVRTGLLFAPDLLEAGQAPSLDQLAPHIAQMLQDAFGTPGGDTEAGRALLKTMLAAGRAAIQAQSDLNRQKAANGEQSS